MLANILGIEYANGTLTFPSYLGMITAGIVGLTSFMFFVVKPLQIKMRRRKAEKNSKYEYKQYEIKVNKERELENLLPQPWLQAYQDCEKVDDYLMKHAWFKEWLDRRTEKRHRIAHPDLPKLSVEAITKIAKMTSYGENAKRFMMGRLSLYVIQEEPADDERMRPEIKTMKQFFDVINELGISDPDVIKQMKNFVADVANNRYKHSLGCHSLNCNCLKESAKHIRRQMKWGD